MGGVQPDPFQGCGSEFLSLHDGSLLSCTGKYPLLDAATFRVRHVDLLIDSPTRYGQVDVSLRGLELEIMVLRFKGEPNYDLKGTHEAYL